MKILFLNNSSLLTLGLASGFSPLDEIRFLSVQEPAWELKINTLVSEWKPDFALAEGCSLTQAAHKIYPFLRHRHIPFVYWAIDDPPKWRQMSLPLSRSAALVLTPAEECLPLYQAQNLQAQYLHFAANPAFHRHLPPVPQYSCDLMLVANYYSWFPQRQVGLETILDPLVACDFDLKVYGNEGWLENPEHYVLPAKYYHGYLEYSQLPAAYSSAKIVLGLHSVVGSPTMMSMRTFEALGCGAFFLTHWTPAIENMFKNHVHLVWSRNPDETPELVRFYLKRDDLRQKIANQGQAEVYLNHTYAQRIQSIRPHLEALMIRRSAL